MIELQKKVEFILTKQEYSDLVTNGSITKNGITHTYDPTIEYKVIGHYLDSEEIARDYQAKLVSGTNIKTVNGMSLLGSGDLEIGGGDVDDEMSDESENAVQNKVIKAYVDTEIDETIGDAMWQILGGGTNE